MAGKPPPYNPAMHPPPMGPPPPYQQMPPPPVPVGFVATHPASSSTTIITSQQPTYGAIPVVVNPVRASDVIVVGGCPACRVGVLSEDFTLAGLCCAFMFFPLGILFCLAMRERRCSSCGACFN